MPVEFVELKDTNYQNVAEVEEAIKNEFNKPGVKLGVLHYSARSDCLDCEKLDAAIPQDFYDSFQNIVVVKYTMDNQSGYMYPFKRHHSELEFYPNFTFFKYDNIARKFKQLDYTDIPFAHIAIDGFPCPEALERKIRKLL